MGEFWMCDSSWVEPVRFTEPQNPVTDSLDFVTPVMTWKKLLSNHDFVWCPVSQLTDTTSLNLRVTFPLSLMDSGARLVLPFPAVRSGQVTRVRADPREWVTFNPGGRLPVLDMTTGPTEQPDAATWAIAIRQTGQVTKFTGWCSPGYWSDFSSCICHAMVILNSSMCSV